MNENNENSEGDMWSQIESGEAFQKKPETAATENPDDDHIEKMGLPILFSEVEGGRMSDKEIKASQGKLREGVSDNPHNFFGKKEDAFGGRESGGPVGEEKPEQAVPTEKKLEVVEGELVDEKESRKQDRRIKERRNGGGDKGEGDVVDVVPEVIGSKREKTEKEKWDEEVVSKQQKEYEVKVAEINAKHDAKQRKMEKERLEKEARAQKEFNDRKTARRLRREKKAREDKAEINAKGVREQERVKKQKAEKGLNDEELSELNGLVGGSGFEERIMELARKYGLGEHVKKKLEEIKKPEKVVTPDEVVPVEVEVGPEVTPAVDGEKLNDAEKIWTRRITKKMLHAKTPRGLQLNEQEKGTGSGWDDYGDKELQRLAGIWSGLYYDKTDTSEAYGTSYLVKMLPNVSGVGGDVIKIAFAHSAKGVDDIRITTDPDGNRYFPAFIDLVVPVGQGEELKKDIISGKVRADRLIVEYFPGLDGRILIRDKAKDFSENN